MIRASDLRAGDVLTSLDPRDDGRRVMVHEIDGEWIKVSNVTTGRKGRLRSPLRKWEHTTAAFEEEGQR